LIAIRSDFSPKKIILTVNAFNAALPGVGGLIVAFSSLLFGFSSLIANPYYGEISFGYLFGYRIRLPFRWIFCGMILLGHPAGGSRLVDRGCLQRHDGIDEPDRHLGIGRNGGGGGAFVYGEIRGAGSELLEGFFSVTLEHLVVHFAQALGEHLGERAPHLGGKDRVPAEQYVQIESPQGEYI
jgi:hypothetical protein